MRTILHSTRSVSTIEYDPTVPCLIDTVTEFLYSVEFKEHMNKGLELLIEKKKDHGEIGWLANTKSVVVFPDDDTKWIIEDWFPRLVEAGIRHIAMVLPEDELVLMSNDVFDENYDEVAKELVIKHFKDIDSAREWLAKSLKKN
ncbi:MAG TPA: hypothetical protein VL443_03370 [Cyclobacteriaceae bacterium]|jgi:hypothetical protein|nr:hypothetical protein [Cyclobacteriaceae bacterium]